MSARDGEEGRHGRARKAVRHLAVANLLAPSEMIDELEPLLINHGVHLPRVTMGGMPRVTMGVMPRVTTGR